MLKADIVIATYNGAKRIGRTLESLEAMATSMGLAQDEWRILLANNNSTDNTAEIAASFASRIPITVIEAKRPGKSAALNDVLPHFKAPLIVLSDDDVQVEPDWLAQFLKIADEQPDYALFAGRIVGHWEQELDPDLASWIPVGSTYALHDDTITSGPCDPGQAWGPNRAIRRSVFDAGVRFNENIGPMPKPLYPMGEDTELAKRLYLLGYKSYFIAEARVHHTIKKETANEDWIIRRAERLGYGIFIVKGMKNYDRRLPQFLPLACELLFLKTLYAVLFPLTHILPASRRRFWARWLFYFYRGLWKSYRDFGQS